MAGKPISRGSWGTWAVIHSESIDAREREENEYYYPAPKNPPKSIAKQRNVKKDDGESNTAKPSITINRRTISECYSAPKTNLCLYDSTTLIQGKCFVELIHGGFTYCVFKYCPMCKRYYLRDLTADKMKKGFKLIIHEIDPNVIKAATKHFK